MDFEERYLGFGTYFTAEAKERIYSEALNETVGEFRCL